MEILKVPMTRIFFFFWRKYLVHHMYKPIPMRENYLKTRSFRALKCSYFVLTVSRGLTSLIILYSQRWNTLEITCDSEVYLSLASSTGSCEYGSAVGRRTALHQTKISTKTDKDRFSPAVFRWRSEQKNTRNLMFSLLRLCFVFYDKIYVKSG